MKLLINLVTGLFFLIGVLIALKTKNNKNLVCFSIGMAFSVLICLLLLDILPETLESFDQFKYISVFLGATIGVSILCIMERKVPHHDHYKEIKHHSNHLNHIGIITSIALIIHNLVEGMSLYAVSNTDLKAGIIYAIAVGLHNIPFGMEITALFDKKEKNKMWLYIFLLTISTFVGGLLIFIFEGVITPFITGIMLSISIGMILYLIFNELFVELKENFNKYSFFGLLTGIILILLGELI